MPSTVSRGLRVCLCCALWLQVGLASASAAGPIQLVTVRDPGQDAPATANGDSGLALFSADGSHVLFASTANNLLVNSNGNALPGMFPARFNVFCRDRTNATTTLVSLNLKGDGGGNEDSLPAGISADGRFALLESRASDLVPGDTNQASDIFVRDLVSNRTVLVSISTNGGFGNGASRSAVITPDGRYVAFVSTANNLVLNDTNGIADVFVRDLQENTTILISPGARQRPAAPIALSDSPLITPDGRYVVFYSTATNLVSGAPASSIYVRDLLNNTTTWASVDASNQVYSAFQGSKTFCFNHAISADGQFVVYEASPGPKTATTTSGVILRYTLQTGLTETIHTNAAIAGTSFEDIRSLDLSPDGRFIAFVADTNVLGTTNLCILVWDGQTGGITLASADTNNTASPGSICKWPTIDPDGRFVTFMSTATDLTTNSLVGLFHLYWRDTLTGITQLVDADTNGVGSFIGPATIPRLSADGQLVAFEASDGSLVPNGHNRQGDVFVRDLSSGTTELISARHAALGSISPNGPSALRTGSVSQDGRFVVFSSDADNLVPNDTNGFSDIFVRDLVAATNFLISVATNGAAANGSSTEPVISADGRFVAFTSRANNLVSGDTNKTLDVFLRDRLTGTTSLISLGTNGVSPGNDQSYFPTLSADGRYVLFRSRARNLFPGSLSGNENLVMRDLQNGTNYGLTVGGVSAASMTTDGRFVLFSGAAVGIFPYLYLWDSQLNARVYTNTSSAPIAVSISPDGNRLAHISGTQLYAVDRAANTNWLIAQAGSAAHAGLSFSGDGRFLAYAGAPLLTTTSQIYLYDFQTGINLLLSQGFNPADVGDAVSDLPTISGDGTHIAYRSTAGNLVPNDTNQWPDIFLYDRVSPTTTLLSSSFQANRSADILSIMGFFSGDGTTLVFNSWASDLLPGDINGSSDIFAYALSNAAPLSTFSATITPDFAVPGGLWISWSVLPGKTYHVQFKTDLTQAQWQELAATVRILGSRGFLRDTFSLEAQKFYRVVAD